MQTLLDELTAFDQFGRKTRIVDFPDPAVDLPVFVNEFWTSKQRAANRIHEVSYRACFKPQLPRFFIERLTGPGDVVHDPFMGRGTTPIEAALLDRTPSGCDINPLSAILVEPRIDPPTLVELEAAVARLPALDTELPGLPEDLLVFFHPQTLRRIGNLRRHLVERAASGQLDRAERWMRMVATNRLTGHSPGFFSVYTLPPNQATYVEAQRKINEKRNQVPPERDILAIITKKSRALMGQLDAASLGSLRRRAPEARLVTASADNTPAIPDASVTLVVTSPPFLDVVDYKTDNWLRCWFNGIDASNVKIWQLRKPADWSARMESVFREMHRILRPGGHVAFEVGEVRKGKILMETLVVPAAVAAGLEPVLVLVNDQKFTKTAQCWGVDNTTKGTNTNRIVLLRKP